MKASDSEKVQQLLKPVRSYGSDEGFRPRTPLAILPAQADR
jgi:hypothetical protein